MVDWEYWLNDWPDHPIAVTRANAADGYPRPLIVDEIFEALEVLRAEGRSLLLMEQYVERAIGIAGYVYILQKGDVVFVGEPSQCASGVVFARYLGASA